MVAISERVASSQYQAIADDSLKDEDNGIWLLSLPPTVQAVWLQRFHWLRWVDRLAEQDQLVQQQGQQFPQVYGAWKGLLQTRQLPAIATQWPVLQEIYRCWFLEGDAQSQSEILAWDRYMDAVATYHQPDLALHTLADYGEMLEKLAGACLQFLPFLVPEQRAAAGCFGAVDQFYNNLRDLYEDAQQGVCYFPADVLQRFSVDRQEILDLTCFDNPGYSRMMEFWMDDYLPQLRRQTLSLILAADLHPSWQCLLRWFIHRYMRVERVMRSCRFNFVEFAQIYWEEVRRDLHYQRAQWAHPTAVSHIHQIYQMSEVALFLKVSPAVLEALYANQQWLTSSPAQEARRLKVESEYF